MRHGDAWLTVLVALLTLALPCAPASGQSNGQTALFGQIRQLYQQGNYAEALPLAQNYAELLRGQFGGTDARTRIAQRNLIEILESAATLAEAQNATDVSIRLRLQALAVAERAFGAGSLDVASILAVIGQQYWRWINSARTNADSQQVIEQAIGQMLAEVDPALGTKLAEADSQAQHNVESAPEDMLRRALAQNPPPSKTVATHARSR